MHPPTPSSTLTSHNLTFFNSLASKYDIYPWQKKVAQQITTYIQEHLDFIDIPKQNSENTTTNNDKNNNNTTSTLLDYACGTGMMSRALGPSVTNIKAIDLSPNMVARFNELAASSEIPSVRKAHAIVGNLLTDEDNPPALELSGPDFHNFSIIAIGAGLHHFPNPAKAISRLAERLKFGGVLLIFDFVAEGEEWTVPSGAEHTIHKHGFREGEMRGLMEGSGLGGVGWREMEGGLEIRVDEGRVVERKGFLARGVRV